MASGLIGNEVHRKVLRVRLPCPPLRQVEQPTLCVVRCRFLNLSAVVSMG